MRAFAAALLLVPSLGHADCEPGRVTLRGDFGTAGFGVEIADDAAERAQGLMDRPSMPAGQGMLFVYERPQRASFWMRNTLIPLDMLFADETGVITRIRPEAVPLDETSIDGGEGVMYVLEINGGLAERLGIEEGDAMQHPLIGAGAKLPCD